MFFLYHRIPLLSRLEQGSSNRIKLELLNKVRPSLTRCFIPDEYDLIGLLIWCSISMASENSLAVVLILNRLKL